MLGLAGLSDSIIDWQVWFEQGVMNHWRSLKAWIIAVILWWVPFHVPSWFLDYSIISAVVTRSSPIPKWNEHWRYGPDEALRDYGRIPLHWKLEWLMSHFLLRSYKVVLLFLAWPIALPVLCIEAIRGSAFAKDIVMEKRERRVETSRWLTRILGYAAGFIPVLFVCSTILYEHG